MIKFLSLKDNSTCQRQFPWCSRLRVDRMGDGLCPACGSPMLGVPTGPCEIETDRGSRWPDFLSDRSHLRLPIVSERVLADLRASGIECFRSYPVVLSKIKSKKLSVPSPNYVYLVPTAEVEADLKAGGYDKAIACNVCCRLRGPLEIGSPKTIIKEGTWDGADVFLIEHHPPSNVWGCTVRVLELARQHRWTNCRFLSLDTPLGSDTHWNTGIDYLGKKWPPEHWYPPQPDEGHSAEEWFEIYMTTSSVGERYDAWRALILLSGEVQPHVIDRWPVVLQEGDEKQIKRLAMLVFLLFHQGHTIPEAIRAKARELYPDAMKMK